MTRSSHVADSELCSSDPIACLVLTCAGMVMKGLKPLDPHPDLIRGAAGQ